MRVTTLVNKLIGLQGLWVRNFHFQADKARVVVDVVPRRRKPLCGVCGRKVRKNKDRYNRYWRHLDLFGVEDGRQRRSELFPSDVAFGATDHPAGGCRATG